MISVERLKDFFFCDQESGLIYRVQDARKQNPIGAVSPNGYLKLRCGGVNLYAHRVVWALVYGVWPEHDVDHINGDRIDNRISNLRSTQRHENLQNMQKRLPGVSGVRGITWDKQTQLWRAQLRLKGKSINIGRFADKQEAEQAYREAKRKHHPFWNEVA